MTVGMPPGRGCSRLRLNQESLKDSEHRRALMGLSMLHSESRAAETATSKCAPASREVAQYGQSGRDHSEQGL